METSKIHIIIDAGHGGNDPRTGEYLTRKDWGKFYKFLQADNRTLDFEVREGVTNRLIADKLAKKLELAGIEYSKIYHPHNDTPLATLAQTANKIHFEKSKQGKKCVLLSFHSNAAGNNSQGQGAAARGVSFWTTKGMTTSDKVAEIWFQEHQKECGNIISYRTEMSDGDRDYEEDFYILYCTSMPAVLIENLFFDNKLDAQILLTDSYQNKSAQAAFNMIQRIAKENVL
jgi:N-acetylmuramoyl-L-alanine amidase